MAKHSSQESKTSTNITSNLKEHNVAKHENHASSCDKCALNAPSVPYYNVCEGGDEVKEDNPDVTLASNDGQCVGGGA